MADPNGMAKVAVKSRAKKERMAILRCIVLL
jgi:hypothetical protein